MARRYGRLAYAQRRRHRHAYALARSTAAGRYGRLAQAPQALFLDTDVPHYAKAKQALITAPIRFNAMQEIFRPCAAMPQLAYAIKILAIELYPTNGTGEKGRVRSTTRGWEGSPVPNWNPRPPGVGGVARSKRNLCAAPGQRLQPNRYSFLASFVTLFTVLTAFTQR